MIIGLTGLPCCGANSFADFLVERGFVWLSYSDVLRELLREQGVEITREAMQDLANTLRENYGAGELSRRLLARMDPSRNYVIGTIRNPGEIAVFRTHPGFVLVAVHASPKIRYRRLIARNREHDAKTSWEDFMHLNARELGEGQPAHGLQIGACLAVADHTLVNEGTLSDLQNSAESIIYSIMCRT